MLPKGRRLRAAEVREVLARGRSARSGGLSAKYHSSLQPLRTAAIVSKKVAKSAVTRNRLRRALYRALAPLSGRGELVIFIQQIPLVPLTPAFVVDLTHIFKKIPELSN
jgi:ribonuclease P protein component